MWNVFSEIQYFYGVNECYVKCHVQDVPAASIDAETASVKSSAPRLVVFVGIHGEMEEAVITADSTRVFTRASSFYEAMLLLIAAYYVADFAYPKVYVNILSILQQFVVGEAYTGERSTNCITFLKKYQKKYVRVFLLECCVPV